MLLHPPLRFTSALLLVLCHAVQAQADCPPAAPLPEVRVSINDGAAQFTVEIADTEAARRAGLMCRESLPADRGMLFVYPAPREARMWMQNMRLPLDMLFIDAEGRIVKIASHVAPGATSRIHSGQPVTAVLELPAGTADRHGIRIGDRVLRHAP
jgi:uncharacterized protein